MISMDYRKPVVFGENWSPSRYKVLPYFAVEKAILMNPGVERILDLGCANGWNMSRFGQYGRPSIGLDTVTDRIILAQEHGPVMVASGLEVPVAAETFDIVYVQHVLHHIGNVKVALQEASRLLKPGGCLFLIETIEDSPIIHWGRKFYPRWMGDEINAPFYFSTLKEQVIDAGFQVTAGEQYSVIFWLWEILPDKFPWMEKLTPIFVLFEQLSARFLRHFSAHCYLVALKQ